MRPGGQPGCPRRGAGTRDAGAGRCNSAGPARLHQRAGPAPRMVQRHAGPRGRSRRCVVNGPARRWFTLVAAAAGLLGLAGCVVSFEGVSAAAGPSFGVLAPAVPVGIDLGILVFSAAGLLLAWLDMPARWLRLVPWALTGATIALNVAGQTDMFGVVAHAA